MTEASQKSILATIPINFFRRPEMNIFNGETEGLKGGAFRLRAVGSDDEGNPRRSKEYLFFGNGMFSMACPREEIIQSQQEEGIWGYEYIFTQKPTVKKDGSFWQVTAPQRNTTVYHHTKDIRVLRVSSTKPFGKALFLVQVEDAVSQYIYIE